MQPKSKNVLSVSAQRQAVKYGDQYNDDYWKKQMAETCIINL
jgi:hypothetical protein